MGRHAGGSHRTVQRVWSTNDLKPHEDFQALQRAELRGEILDVIGLYLDPPLKALILCCDETSQCQALERTQLSLPLAASGHVK